MTYTETKGEDPIDWNARLNQEVITDQEWNQWRIESGQWITCACGNQCSIIPRRADHKPNDKELYGLGLEFFNRITQRDIKLSKNVLERIEIRSAELIEEIKSKGL